MSLDFSIVATLLLLVGISGFFSAAEIGLISLPRLRAQHWSDSSHPSGRALHWLLAHPATMLGAILISITAANYIGETIASTWVIERLGRDHLWLAIVSMSVLVIIFGEVVPILYAAANPEKVALFVALPVRLAASLLAVPAWIISAFASLLGGGKEWSRVGLVTAEELRALVSFKSEQAPLEEEEKEMLHSIFEFADKVATDVMVPKARIVALPDSARLQEAAALASARRLSRLPVFHGSLDTIVGVVFVKDLLRPLKNNQHQSPVTEVMRGVFSVPENKQLSDLLTELRRRKQMLAVVENLQGKTAGLVTMEDLLEEIVGDIFDEYDLATPAVERQGNSIVVDGRTSIEEVNELLEAALPEGRYGTIAGLLLNRLGALPRQGEGLEVDGFLLTVVRMDDHRVARVRITRLPAEGEASND
jgi:putative hemolysin